jgi:hypothetical protein
MREKYKMTSVQVEALKKTARTDSSTFMFKALTVTQQLKVLDKSTDEEKTKFLKIAKEETKKQLRLKEAE